jgi:hypothetical protein
VVCDLWEGVHVQFGMRKESINGGTILHGTLDLVFCYLLRPKLLKLYR